MSGVHILVRKLYLSPPPSENYIFLSFGTRRILLLLWSFCLILPYFAFILNGEEDKKKVKKEICKTIGKEGKAMVKPYQMNFDYLGKYG
jgi:hypothetical protein